MPSSKTRQAVSLVCLALAGLLWAGSDAISAPQLINYQGKLTDGAGNPINEPRDFVFGIYDVETGGTPVWTEAQNGVPVSNGIFNVILGTSNPITTLPDGPDCYLAVTVGGDPILPRVRMVSTPYTLKADDADKLDGQHASDFAGSGHAHAASGDVSGSVPGSLTVAGLQTRPVASTGPLPNQVLKWNGTAWAPGDDQTGGGSGLWTDAGSYIYPNDNSNVQVYDDGGTYGVYAYNSSGYAVYGRGYYSGVYGASTSSFNPGVYGYSSSGEGVFGRGSPGVYGQGGSYGMYGYGTSAGVYGDGGTYGVYSNGNMRAQGNIYASGDIETSSGTVYGGSSYLNGTTYGVYSSKQARVQGDLYATGDITGSSVYGGTNYLNGTTYGVYSSKQARVQGNLYVSGTLTKGSGTFLIDHPLDPYNKVLRHSFVESPEDLCLYRGKVSLGPDGSAVVKMPDYFPALTRETDASINLTAVGRPFNTGCEWNRDFTAFTVFGEPGRMVYYIVLADRDDPLIHLLRRPVEEAKTGSERGKLQYPETRGAYEKTSAEDILHTPKTTTGE